MGVAGLLTKLRSQSLLAAWNSWRAFVPRQQMKKAGLQLAAGHWAHRELAMAFDMFRWAPLGGFLVRCQHAAASAHWQVQLTVQHICPVKVKPLCLP